MVRPRRATIEHRVGGRLDVRESDGIRAEISFEGRTLPARVWDLTTLGACLIVSDDLVPEPFSIVRVKVSFPWGESVAADYQVRWVSPVKEGLKLGLQITSSSISQTTAQADAMLRISASFPVTGYVYKQIYYQERSIFRLVALSKEYVLIDVLDQEHILFPNQSVELLFSLQSTKSDKLRGRIVQIQQVNRDSVRILIKSEDMTGVLEDDIVNHLILDPSLDLETIRHAGFKIKHIANNFRFRFVKTQEDYEAVLRLRLAAYMSAGKVREGTTAEMMRAPLDDISRILIALHGDKVIASVALSFPQSQDVVLDTERPLDLGYPPSIPPKIEMIEVARLCTDPNYRRGDLLLRMFEHIYQVFATSDRKYLISSTDKKLWPIYRNLGFKKTGIKYPHPYLAGIEHEIILIDLEVPTAGAQIGFRRWWYLYARMTDYVERKRELERSGLNLWRHRLFKLAARALNRVSKR